MKWQCVVEFFFSSSQNKIKYGVSEIKFLSPSLRNFPYEEKRKKQIQSFTEVCTYIFFLLKPNGKILAICIQSLKMQLFTVKM